MQKKKSFAKTNCVKMKLFFFLVFLYAKPHHVKISLLKYSEIIVADPGVAPLLDAVVVPERVPQQREEEALGPARSRRPRVVHRRSVVRLAVSTSSPPTSHDAREILLAAPAPGLDRVLDLVEGGEEGVVILESRERVAFMSWGETGKGLHP